MDNTRELVEDALRSLVEDKKTDFGLFKFEMRTDGDSVWITGAKSGLYKDIEEDLLSYEKEQVDKQIDALQQELIKLQDLVVELVEDRG